MAAGQDVVKNSGLAAPHIKPLGAGADTGGRNYNFWLQQHQT